MATTGTATRHGAQMVFHQAQGNDAIWYGRLLNPKALDSQAGDRPAHTPEGHPNYTCQIAEHSPTCYELTTSGSHPGGTRYRSFDSLDKAQEAAVAWARRRFYWV